MKLQSQPYSSRRHVHPPNSSNPSSILRKPISVAWTRNPIIGDDRSFMTVGEGGNEDWPGGRVLRLLAPNASHSAANRSGESWRSQNAEAKSNDEIRSAPNCTQFKFFKQIYGKIYHFWLGLAECVEPNPKVKDRFSATIFYISSFCVAEPDPFVKQH